jgi:hypothetical protein
MQVEGVHAGASQPIEMLVLGPMDPRTGDPIPRTVRLKRIIQAIASELKREYSNENFNVRGPEDLAGGPVISGVIDLIEDADLVIADLEESSPNVSYEVAIVQTLGIPIILVTGDKNVPFYLRNTLYIGDFLIEQEVNLRTPENVNSGFYVSLTEKIREFVKALLIVRAPSTTDLDYRTASENIKPYRTNELTACFDDMPIVDVAGPSSLASGYYRNAIRRFVLADKFFDDNFEWDPNPAAEENAPSSIAKFVVVFPPEPMSTYPEDNKKLQSLLAEHGFAIKLRGIKDRQPATGLRTDLRPYIGNFLATRDGTLVDPAVVMEIPTTLYALQDVPRIWRIERRRRDALIRRRIDDMLSSFERALDYFMRRERIGNNRHKVLFTRFRHVTGLLDQIVGVKPNS